MELHPDVIAIAPLLGTWAGVGRGVYPTIDGFDFADGWEFTTTGKPFVSFVQRTKTPDGLPLHTEAGYLRCPSPGVVEIVCALPMGQTELGTGSVAIEGGTLTVRTDADVQVTPSAKQVDRITRRFVLTGETLTYEMSMAAVGLPLTHHLSSELHRVP